MGKKVGMLYINTSDKLNKYTNKPIKYISGEVNGVSVYGFINTSKDVNKETGKPVIYIELVEQEDLKKVKSKPKKVNEDFDF